MLITLLSILPIVIGFGFLVFVHELGHFWAAKWAGIRAEGFAVGMGPVAISWRKGIGLRAGSSSREYSRRISSQVEATRKEQLEFRERTDAPTMDEIIEAEKVLGIGETEYSLRWLPIGGFVKMLGQEDLSPNAVSAHPRAYTSVSVPRRMVVVSAGVIMNIITAGIFFVIAFLVGVRFEAPYAGGAADGMPAATSIAREAEAFGIQEPGIRAGDIVRSIDGDTIRTFNDIILAVAMSKPGEELAIEVDRAGFDEPLTFDVEPVVDPTTRLRSIGMQIGRSPAIMDDEAVTALLDRAFEAHPDLRAAIGPGLSLETVEGRAIRTIEEAYDIARTGDGTPLATTWRTADGTTIDLEIPVTPSFEVMSAFIEPRGLRPSGRTPAGSVSAESGIAGLLQPVEIAATMPDSPNPGTFEPGDLVARINGLHWPSFGDMVSELRASSGLIVEMDVVRGGELVSMQPTVDRNGRLGISLNRFGRFDGVPITATPLAAIVSAEAMLDPTSIEGGDPSEASTAGIPGGAWITSVGGTPVADWGGIREAMRRVASALDGGGTIDVAWRPWDEPGAAPTVTPLVLTEARTRTLADLGWEPLLPLPAFDVLWVDLDAGGDPIEAIALGGHETLRVVTMTYLTIDRLFRRSIGVEQLRGPVGIVDLGVQVLPRGFMYLLFLLGMISINLAVLNFLPLPIVDGGLFLYLVYESFTGRPPPVAFQNFATLAGLGLLATLFIVTFYNDVSRLL